MGVNDACEEQNVNCDIFTISVQDNEGEPSQAVSVLQQQRLQEIDAYISGTSEMTNAIASQVSDLGVPHFVAAFDAYVTRGFPSRMRIMPHYKIEGPKYIEYAQFLGTKKVYIINLNISSINEEFSEIVEPAFDSIGISYQRETFGLDTNDFRSLALKASEYNPDLVIISGFAFHLQPLVGALRTYDLVENSSVLSTMDYVDLIYGDAPREELTGVAFTTPLTEIPGKVEGLERWRERFREKHGSRASYVEAYAYETGRTLVRAHAQTGEVSVESIRKVLPYDGIVGRIALDQEGDLRTTLTIARIRSDGSVQQVSMQKMAEVQPQ